jgi:hypothetical protein
MEGGIPLRRVAIQVGGIFRQEVEQHSPETFLRWLGSLTNEKLLFDFGVQSPLLEDITKRLRLTASNPVLQEFPDVHDYLPRDTWIQGIGYENRAAAALLLQVDQNVEVERDYDNPVDRNALCAEFVNTRETLCNLTDLRFVDYSIVWS